MFNCNLIFHEDDNETNKELTKYLDKNLNEILHKGKIYFNFIIATANDKIKLKKDGILDLPALIPENVNPIIGIKNIYKYINYCIKNPQQKKVKSEEEILQEFMNKEIQDGVKKVKDGNKKKLIINQEEDNDDEFSNDNINRKIQNEQKKRGINSNDINSDNSNMDELYTPNRPNNLSENFNTEEEIDDEDNVENTTSEKSINNYKNEPMNIFNNISSNTNNKDDDMFKSLLEKMNDE
jgi:hypothetical protein